MMDKPLHSPAWKPYRDLTLLAVAYFAGARLGLFFPTHDSHITLFWLPTGMATAILLRWGSPHLVAGIFLGACVFDLSLGTSLPLSLLSAAGNTLTPLIAVWLLKRWEFAPSFTRQYDLLALIAASAISPLFPTVIGIGTLWLGGLLQPSGMLLAGFNWWLGDLISIMLVSPLLLSLNRPSISELQRSPLQLVFCILLLGISGSLTFLTSFENHILPLAFLPLPLVLWAALRLGVSGTSLSVLALALLTAVGTAMGKGVFGALPPIEGMYLAWLYMFITALIGLMVTTMLGERKTLLASLQRANELLSLAQRTSKAGVWNWDLATNRLTWSDELFTLFGLDPRTSLSTFETWQNLLHPEDRTAAENRVAASLRDRTPLYNEYRIILPDGETKWIVALGNTHRDPDSGAERMAGLCIDITGHKQAEERIHSNEELLRQTQAVAHVGSWRLDLQRDILVWSDETYRIFGIAPGTPLTYLNFLDQVHPDDRAKVDAAWCNALKNGSYLTQHRIVVDGDIRWVEERAHIVCDQNGVPLSGTGSVQDITARIRSEELLLDSFRKLEEKELSKTRFLAAAGHDLRQPVAAANLFVDTLKLTSPTPRQSEIIERLDQSMQIFSGLLERLLDISKFDAGLIKPHFTSIDLSELFNWLAHNFAQGAHEKQLDFRLWFPTRRTLTLRTDIGLLQSVLMNLVGNAIKFTPQGGILVGARVRGRHILIQVWDTGIGIAEADAAHIFEEFYQAANSQRNRDAGLGLGLSICQRAMALLGGEVTCRSRPGSGSVFAFRIPLNGEAHAIEHLVAGPIQDDIAHERLVKGKRLVVVEDDALVASGLINLLQGLGAEVLHYYSAEDTLRHADIGSADYFIVDYSLSGKLSGLDLLSHLQQGRPDPIRAVIITGETSSGFIHVTRDIPWPTLHKPANLARLLAALHQQTAP
jgi:PAS domain S-box-containing protein